MKKLFLICLFLLLIITPAFVSATGLVPCGNPGEQACTIGDFFVMLARIYDFIVWWLVVPLAILMLTIGGVMLMISAGNPNLASKGKQIVWVSIIGLVLVFCSWLIIDWVLKAMGYSLGTWYQL